MQAGEIKEGLIEGNKVINYLGNFDIHVVFTTKRIIIQEILSVF